VFLVLLLLVLVPVVELFVAVEVADAIGVGLTILALVALAVGGIWLVKAEGLGVLRRVQRQLEAGELPAADVVDGLLILAAGVLMLVPGFVTAAVGLLLLIPFTRRPVRTLVLRRLERRLARGSFVATTVVDVSSYERHAPRDPLDPPAIEPGAGSRVD
jgi:UPF0716 protein FxsA